MKKIFEEKYIPIKTILLFVLVLLLVLVDKFLDYHISGILFFSILYIISLPIIFYQIVKYFKADGVFAALHVLVYLLFFYMAVYYIFVPAFTLGKVIGILIFILIVICFLILSLIGVFVAVIIPLMIEDHVKSKIGIKIINGLKIILTIASILILLSLGRFWLSWGFQEEYVNVIVDNSFPFMVSIMNCLFNK